MAQNKIITSVSAIVDNVISPTDSNVVCIDTRNSRIGVKNSIPLYEIDVSGTININGSLINGSNIIDSSGISTNSISVGTNTKISDTSTNFSGLVNFQNIICASGNFPKCTISDCSITTLTCMSNFFVRSITKIGTNDISINGNLVIDSSLNSIKTTTLFVRNISGSDISISGRDISINGNVWIDGSLNIKGTATTAITGDAITTGGVLSGFINLRSDDRLKQNEEAIINALLIIRKLNPQIYQKTANFMALDYRGQVEQPYIVEAGLIAQEVEKIDELKFSVIRGNEQTPYSINYNSIFIYCLAALKELDTNVENIKNVLNFNSQSNNGTSNTSNTSNTNGTSNPDLINIINNQNIQIQELINKISILENRISNIEKAF